ncbi:MAG: RNA polymerase sigma factor [Candidatus Eiseniibacteriota bacterium]
MTRNVEFRIADLVRCACDSRASIREQHAAFAMLVERFEEMAFATALGACEDVETARDACQEAFLVAWRKLPALRDPAAFGGWLKRLVRTQCVRARHRDASAESRGWVLPETLEHSCDTAEFVDRREVQALVRSAVMSLPPAEREAVILFYFLGESLRDVARALGVTVGSAGKRIYNARLRLRRGLPRSVTASFWMRAPTASFARRVRAGLFDELVGEYRFDERPGHRVVVRREGDVLASYAGGQRNVLTSRGPDTLAPAEYDGEARIRRGPGGRVSHFIYYESGRRLGVARKLRGAT